MRGDHKDPYSRTLRTVPPSVWDKEGSRGESAECAERLSQEAHFAMAQGQSVHSGSEGVMGWAFRALLVEIPERASGGCRRDYRAATVHAPYRTRTQAEARREVDSGLQRPLDGDVLLQTSVAHGFCRPQTSQAGAERAGRGGHGHSGLSARAGGLRLQNRHSRGTDYQRLRRKSSPTSSPLSTRDSLPPTAIRSISGTLLPPNAGRMPSSAAACRSDWPARRIRKS